ncbi:MAG TPA: HNH endonuclease signature motif containing protein, partial [Ilumatobacteraceae bacterium]|nr:HNH endonuclease signature motif containing protein [Ilumatobacteraceae bacterium]
MSATTSLSGEELDALWADVVTQAGVLNAAHARLVALTEKALRHGAWGGEGVRSPTHWLCWQTGVSRSTADKILQLASSRDTHPEVMASFDAGALSLDQASVAVQAPPHCDHDIATLAVLSTVSQIRTEVRVANQTRPNDVPAAADQSAASAQPETSTDATSPDDVAADGDDAFDPSQPMVVPVVDEAPSSVRLLWGTDGRLSIRGDLTVDDGTLLEAALLAAKDRLFHSGQEATLARALLDIAQRGLDAEPAERRERFRINLFLAPDASQAQWTNHVPVPDWLLSQLCCTTSVSPVHTDAAGLPVSVGRSAKALPDRTRRLVLHRDRGRCQNPRCGSRVGLHIHHIWFWSRGGPTDTNNLVTVCGRCHRAVHTGHLRVHGNPDDPGGATFTERSGRPIERPIAGPPAEPPPQPDPPY